MTYCSSCGNQIQEEKFCGKCGAKSSVGQKEDASSKNKPKKKVSVSGFFFGFVTFCVGVWASKAITGIIGVIFFGLVLGFDASQGTETGRNIEASANIIGLVGGLYFAKKTYQNILSKGWV